MTNIGTRFDYVMAKIRMLLDPNGFFIKIINVKVFGPKSKMKGMGVIY